MHTHPSSWCTRINQGKGRVARSCSFLLCFLELKIYCGTGCTLRLEINLGKRKRERTEGELGGGGTERNKRSNEDFLWWVKIISFDGGKYFSGNSNLFLGGDWRFPKKKLSKKCNDKLKWRLNFFTTMFSVGEALWASFQCCSGAPFREVGCLWNNNNFHCRHRINLQIYFGINC